MELRDNWLGRWLAALSMPALYFGLTAALVLASIAYYEYGTYLLIQQRTDGREPLLNLAERQAAYFAAHQRFTADLTELGYTAVGNQSVATPQGFYRLVVTTADDQGYSLAAIPNGEQMADTACGILTLDFQGMAKSAKGAAASSCW